MTIARRFQRRVRGIRTPHPVRKLELSSLVTTPRMNERFGVPAGTLSDVRSIPPVKLAGYCQCSLRDRERSQSIASDALDADRSTGSCNLPLVEIEAFIYTYGLP
jgi:hypothetical protein